MKWLVGMVAFALGAAALGATQQKYPLLIFEFPDGVRGGIGKISGSGPFIGDVLPLLQKCGLNRPQRFDQITHRYFVYARASGRDRQIVGCFMKATSRHFKVGYGKIDESSFGFPRILDQKPFETFARKSR